MKNISLESIPKGSSPLLTVLFLGATVAAVVWSGSQISKERRATHADVAEILASVPNSGPGKE